MLMKQPKKIGNGLVDDGDNNATNERGMLPPRTNGDGGGLRHHPYHHPSNGSGVVVETTTTTNHHHNHRTSTATTNNNNDTTTGEDSISAISDDKSGMSQLSVWQQAKLILMGQNPNDTIIAEGAAEDEEPYYSDDNGIPHSVSARIASFESGEVFQKVQEELQRSVRWDDTVLRSNGQQHGSSSIQQQQQQLHDNNPDETGSVVTTTLNINFLEDDYAEMTYGRRIALFLMKRYSWYNPGLKKQQQQHNDNNNDNNENETIINNNSNNKIGSEERPNDNDATGILRPTNSMDSMNSMNQRTFRVLSEENKNELLINDAYPFTHSTRESPSLERAWAYFEHVALPRHIVEPKPEGYQQKNIFVRMYRKLFCKANKQLQRAEPGETEYETKLYEPIFTPHKQLGDFGLGIGLYFSTLRAITVITLLAGILNTSNFMYFNSSQYNNSTSKSVQNAGALRPVLRGSAICTDTDWVVCNDCNNSTNITSSVRLALGTNIQTKQQQYFARKNNCDGATIQQGMVSYATLLFLMLSTIGLNVYLTRMEIAFDEDEQTAQDYSIVIENPPPDATDPQEWHNFFHEAFNGHVTACTVAVDNDLLIRTLVARREILRCIELAVEPGTSLDTLTIARIATKQERERRLLGRLMALIVPGIPEFFSRLTVMTAKVQGLAQQHYPATNVFITFETEKAQRDVLNAYNLGSIDIKRNNASKLKDPQKHLFRGQLVLKVTEPDEPNTVRWKDLNEKFKERIKQQLLTAFCTVAAICCIATIVYVVNNKNLSTSATAYTIAVFNAVFPEFAKLLTSLEAHASEGDIQRSLYFKIALFRWVNTAVVITIITPFTSTISEKELIPQVYALFFAELTTTNAIQLLDPMGHIKRHFLAPRAITQDAMNIQMQGTVFELAERYTNMTKILFLAMWYCSIYPAALYLCSLALFVMYFMDRFSLMRTWKRAPQLGAKISQFSRKYFFSSAIVFMAIVSSYYWASFPFDNLCDTTITIPTNTTGVWRLKTTTTGDTFETRLTESDTIYKYCLQDFLRYPRKAIRFPFVPRNQLPGMEWMTPDQEIVTNIYGWSAIGVALIVVLSIFRTWYEGFMKLFRGTYEPCGDDMGIEFSDVPSISTYIPQVSSPVFSYPLLAANIDNINCDLLDWTDPEKPHSFYDLTKDAEVLLRGNDFGNNIVFSQIAHWPPPGKKAKKRSSRTKISKID